MQSIKKSKIALVGTFDKLTPDYEYDDDWDICMTGAKHWKGTDVEPWTEQSIDLIQSTDTCKNIKKPKKCLQKKSAKKTFLETFPKESKLLNQIPTKNLVFPDNSCTSFLPEKLDIEFKKSHSRPQATTDGFDKEIIFQSCIKTSSKSKLQSTGILNMLNSIDFLPKKNNSLYTKSECKKAPSIRKGFVKQDPTQMMISNSVNASSLSLDYIKNSKTVKDCPNSREFSSAIHPKKLNRKFHSKPEISFISKSINLEGIPFLISNSKPEITKNEITAADKEALVLELSNAGALDSLNRNYKRLIKSNRHTNGQNDSFRELFKECAKNVTEGRVSKAELLKWRQDRFQDIVFKFESS